MEDNKIVYRSREDSVDTSSFINEIRAHDIYTINSPQVYSGLPGVSGSYCGVDTKTLLDVDPLLNKSNLRCRSIMKKLDFQKKPFINLPALAEEKNKRLSTVRPNTGSPYLPVAGKMDDSKKHNENEVDSEDESVKSEDIYQYEDSDASSLEVLDEDIDESWVDLSKHTQPATSSSSSSFTRAFSSVAPTPSVEGKATCTMSHHAAQAPPKSPERTTPPPFGNGEEYLRLLREAQKESNQSSARASLASSRRDTPRDSPKSPPNSPNTEVVLESEEPTLLKGVYINYYNRDGDFVRVEKNVETDWIWDWSSRPDQTPPKEWKFIHPGGKGVRRGASIRRLMVGNSSLFSRDVLYTLFITNVLSLLLGTGIGIWLSRRSGGGGSGGTIPLAMIPIN